MQHQNCRSILHAGLAASVFLGLAGMTQTANAQALCVEVDVALTDPFVVRPTGVNGNAYTISLQRLSTGGTQDNPATGTLLLLPNATNPTRFVAGWTEHRPNGLSSYYCQVVVTPFPSSDGRVTNVLGGFTPGNTQSSTCRFFSCSP
ncbi:MAG: hypothetical protein H6983_08290 [Ectothiorhodospiraceae bacterium]|nr:hypothetical protein [Chromatiales bacterium]MCP5154146.1 hypothetical protein [Ectothiorhodospiraceae bacterium]